MVDLSGKYNTPLSDDEQKAFDDWRKKLPARLNSTKDYDLQGAFKANAAEAANGHLPDTFKKPNHPTFSTESQYSGKDGNVGGEWSGDDTQGWSFKPSATNLKNMSEDDLKSYFSKQEPKSKLILPPSKADKRYGYAAPGGG